MEVVVVIIGGGGHWWEGRHQHAFKTWGCYYLSQSQSQSQIQSQSQSQSQIQPPWWCLSDHSAVTDQHTSMVDNKTRRVTEEGGVLPATAVVTATVVSATAVVAASVVSAAMVVSE